jgi:hypothetical protein
MQEISEPASGWGEESDETHLEWTCLTIERIVMAIWLTSMRDKLPFRFIKCDSRFSPRRGMTKALEPSCFPYHKTVGTPSANRQEWQRCRYEKRKEMTIETEKIEIERESRVKREEGDKERDRQRDRQRQRERE